MRINPCGTRIHTTAAMADAGEGNAVTVEPKLKKKPVVVQFDGQIAEEDPDDKPVAYAYPPSKRHQSFVLIPLKTDQDAVMQIHPLSK